MMIAVLALIPVVAAYIPSNQLCGDAGLQALKSGQQLHVIADLDKLNKLQDLYGLGPCDDACELVGQTVEFAGNISLDGYGAYWVSVRGPGSLLEVHLAPPCLTELWCGKVAKSACNLGMVAAACLFLFVMIHGAFEIMHQKARQQQILEGLGNNTAQIYEMIVSGRASGELTRVTYGPNSRLRWMAFKLCPWIDLLCLVLVYLSITFSPVFRMFCLVAFSPVLTASIPLVVLLCLRAVLWLCCVIKYWRRATAMETSDIALCALRELDAFCVIYRHYIYWFCNIGNVPEERPHVANTAYRKPMILVRSQLLAHHSHPDDDQTPITGWSFKVCYGRWFPRARGHSNPFLLCGFCMAGWKAFYKDFPVDPARLHDLQRWLMDPTRRELFRYEGVALSATDVLPWDKGRIHDQLRHADEMPVPEAMQLTRVLTLRCSDAGDGLLAIQLSTMAGEMLPLLSAHASDLVADLLYRVSVETNEGFQVKIALPNAKTLDVLDPKQTLAEAFAAFID
eukprot:Skav232310  [mRNA]  locus=scaffold882:682917:684446:- [translate_table: standard]